MQLHATQTVNCSALLVVGEGVKGEGPRGQRGWDIIAMVPWHADGIAVMDRRACANTSADKSMRDVLASNRSEQVAHHAASTSLASKSLAVGMAHY